MAAKGREFLERLAGGFVLGDGAVGTLLSERGVTGDISYEQLNLTRPEIVTGVSAEYVAVGAELIETNSFCANHLKQKRFGLEGKVREMARLSAQLARSVAGPDRFVAGSIGPLARRRADLDEFSESELAGFFREPMEGLAEGGADLLILETFTLLGELEIALSVAKTFGLPVVAQMAFGEEGTTEMGVRAERAAARLAELGADVVGANCRSGPRVLQRVLERQAAVAELPLSVFPNAGYAEQRDGRYVYGASPRYFAASVSDLVAAGARLIGGCCGTTPAHIRAVREALPGLRPPKRERVGKRVVVVAEAPPADRIGGEKFLGLIGRTRPFVTVEVEPPKGTALKAVLDGARAAVTAGADAINIPDNALAQVCLDNVVFAQIVRARLEIPVILHMTCRDKNLIALQSGLLGAQAAGIEAILAVTGDPASIGDQPGASSVYDTNSIGLVEMIRSLNRGVTPWGTELEKPTDLAIGVAVNPNVSGPKGLEGTMFKFRKKIAAGAQFAETQPVYDAELLRKFLDLCAEVRLPVFVGLLPLVGKRNADFLHNEVPGVRIPQEIRNRFEGLRKEEAEAEGLRLAGELVEVALKAGAEHFYIIAPLRRFDLAAELVATIKRAGRSSDA